MEPVYGEILTRFLTVYHRILIRLPNTTASSQRFVTSLVQNANSAIRPGRLACGLFVIWHTDLLTALFAEVEDDIQSLRRVAEFGQHRRRFTAMMHAM